jgi:hypothetical protein
MVDKEEDEPKGDAAHEQQPNSLVHYLYLISHATNNKLRGAALEQQPQFFGSTGNSEKPDHRSGTKKRVCNLI